MLFRSADLALLDLPAHAPARECIDQVIAGTRRAAELTQQMLAYSGKSCLVLEPIRLADLVRQMADLLRVSLSRQVVLATYLAADLPPLQGDAAQLRQVVMNLILNAAEALGEAAGTVTLATRAFNWPGGLLPNSYPAADLAAGLYLCLEVADTGCGMSAETRERLFDPFFTTKFTGRGLGLAAVLGIVRGHRGAIQVQSILGQGTTFRVFLPAELP